MRRIHPFYSIADADRVFQKAQNSSCPALYTPTWQVLGDKKYCFRPSPLDFKTHTTNPSTKCTLQHREHSLNPQLRNFRISNTTFDGAVELSTPPQHHSPP